MAQYAGNPQRDQANKSQGQGENPECPKQGVQTDYMHKEAGDNWTQVKHNRVGQESHRTGSRSEMRGE